MNENDGMNPNESSQNLNPAPVTPQSVVPSPKKRANPLMITLLVAAGFFFLFLMISGFLLLSKGSSGSKSKSSAALFGKGAVGVLEINGVIMDSKKTLERLEQFEEDNSIKAVVIRLNSPGGSVAPSQEIYEAVKKLRAKKPVISSMGSVAASGAYYIAVGTQKIYANAGTITGSIGVIMEFANLEKLYEWAKVKRFSLKTGKFKDAGAEYREMTAEDRALLQGMIDDVLEQFKTAVQEGRKIPRADLDKIADGRIFSGSQAKKVKLVDELGTLQKAIEEAAVLGKISGKPEVVYPSSRKRAFFEYLMDDHGEDSESNSHGGALSWLQLLKRFSKLGASESVDLLGNGSDSQSGVYWIWNGP